ncbi:MULTISPECIES: sigma-54-dependent Fis family transcriptional regulator [unclassified Paenibacillus]|uniref:sigma-54 interaction domain-containing protein n=2 Tax=unclassified Paenibacillus TaxID=185978 RepID=UPI000CFAE20C|nr:MULTISPECIES: sigma 54-interacting transcriptional regulator [unclassified Paenibacillus]MBD8838605.1 sigma 54-interacting transcriptional regulator [Paenibacillus sp. CFBP 13594]PRA02662.1 sigma-54-dependent Fis family transcriptional regulator [Paenibacillus sp. MYb63]PRA45468.1 sigma-54-dependent Fis family transcriptional regulator [Paenibacillus sp. MYb67]QZN78165.1 sigma 54-interacting transcriptional regulator [Paenibacillus sp. DR312]
MKHLLPDLMSLLRTDMDVLDTDLSTLTIPSSTSLIDAFCLFDTSSYLFIQDDGPLLGYIAVSDVLHAMMHAHRLIEAYFETTLETAGSALTLINEDAKVAYWTTGAEHVFSISKKDIIGQPAADFFPPDRLQSLKTLYTGETVYRKQHQPRPDLFALINARPVQLDGHIVGAVAAEVDITTEIRLHQELLHMTSKVQHLEKAVARLRPELDPFARIKGSSPVIKQCMETIRKISTTSATVLILGESGTGKELFAKAIHDLRELQTAPFIAINCGAIPASLFESELFGYEKGAFSGADPKGKKGKIELAEGGTLFLDEIGEMPLELQVKLLRVLQEKSYFPVGGTRVKQADCRIIAATNQNLLRMIARNQFREDLYYRLNVINLVIPPLRMRKEDIYELTQTFLQEFSLLYNRHIELVPPEVFKLLFQYDWPGNVRELRNVIERLTILTTDGEVKQEYLPDTLTSLTMQEQSEVQLTSGFHSHAKSENQQRQDSVGARAEKEPRAVANVDELDHSDDSELVSGVTYQQKLDTHEAQLLIQYLKAAGGNKRTLAKQLGISRATLYNRMKRLGL